MTSTQDSPTPKAPTTAIGDDRRKLLEKLGLMHEDDVCVLCNVQQVTLWTWRKEQRGPAYVKLGREVCYRTQDILAWIADNVVEFIQAPSAAPKPANDDAASDAAKVA